MFDTFFEENNKYPQTLICIIAATLSIEFTQSLNQSFVNTPDLRLFLLLFALAFLYNANFSVRCNACGSKFDIDVDDDVDVAWCACCSAIEMFEGVSEVQGSSDEKNKNGGFCLYI